MTQAAIARKTMTIGEGGTALAFVALAQLSIFIAANAYAPEYAFHAYLFAAASAAAIFAIVNRYYERPVALPPATIDGKPNYNMGPVKFAAVAAMVWGIAGFSVGLWAALELAFPVLNFDLPWLSFGRIRPLHTSAVIFAFGGNVLVATSFYVVQRTCRARLAGDIAPWFVVLGYKRPVYSYRLSIIHFWSLIFLYIWAGPHHLHYTALPDWAQTLGMTFSVMLWMPSWGGMINGIMTLSGAWDKLRTDPVLRMMVVSVAFYGMATFEGPLMSVKAVNSLSHYTDWTIGHVHSGALGWVAYISFGAIYCLMPWLWNRERLYSLKLVNWHFWISTVGIVLYISAMWVSGILQGLMWRAYTKVGFLEYSFVETVEAMHPFYIIRALGGALFLIGAVIMAWNLWRTVYPRRLVVLATGPALAPAE